MPQIGEVRSGKEIDKNVNGRDYYIWVACEDCGKERWVPVTKAKANEPIYRLCYYCAMKQLKGRYKAEAGHNWKGGRNKTSGGYIQVYLDPDSPFAPMAPKESNSNSFGLRVLEHRLIMAQHLGRCLLPSEKVHHKNGIKDDNRFENLQLFSSQAEHNLVNGLCSQCQLRKEIRLLRWELKEALQLKLLEGE